MSENKTSKYLKYAIGEIVLVVIGILIALQINNWNNNRIERRMEKEILKEILVNLETDLQNINETIERNKIWIEHNYLVVEHLENKTPLTDSLKYHYSSLYGYHRFQPIKVAYENLKSEGISIIRNGTLRKNISELYEYQYFFMVEDIRTEIGRIQPIHKNQIITKLKTEQSYVSAQPVNLVALQNDIPFHETLKDVIVYRWWTIGRIKKGREKVIEVISAIENELDKN
ncbi:MAG: hypothetical protein KJN66_01305 [Bacteroidia bacterium]|nr:hypothetical protein [Bacteroidia bacterium]